MILSYTRVPTVPAVEIIKRIILKNIHVETTEHPEAHAQF